VEFVLLCLTDQEILMYIDLTCTGTFITIVMIIMVNQVRAEEETVG